MLEPLRQWICDSCREIINDPAHGYVEWMKTNRKMHGFRIVHHALYSPRKLDGGDCYYSNKDRGGDIALSDLLGVRGLIDLTAWIDVGEWHNQKCDGPQVRDLREWATLFRRLHVPYYEEARLCTAELRDVLSGGANEIYLYMPETLKGIIEERESSAA